MITERFGRLVVLELADPSKTGAKRFRCLCDCGKETITYMQDLKSGHSQSCGCARIELHAKRLTKHGMRRSPEYITWCSMIKRCYNPASKAYAAYGGSGITVCDRWRESFQSFSEDMGSKPTSKHSVDRIDGSQGYGPGNCRWATQKEQSLNRKSTVFMEYNGERLCQKEWAERIGVSEFTIAYWLKNGKNIGEIAEHFKEIQPDGRPRRHWNRPRSMTPNCSTVIPAY